MDGSVSKRAASYSFRALSRMTSRLLTPAHLLLSTLMCSACAVHVQCMCNDIHEMLVQCTECMASARATPWDSSIIAPDEEPAVTEYEPVPGKIQP